MKRPEESPFYCVIKHEAAATFATTSIEMPLYIILYKYGDLCKKKKKYSRKNKSTDSTSLLKEGLVKIDDFFLAVNATMHLFNYRTTVQMERTAIIT